MSQLTHYVHALEQDFFQRPGAVASLLQQASEGLRDQILHIMRTTVASGDYDNPLSVMDEIVFYSQSAPEALLLRAQYLLAAERPQDARKDLQRVLRDGTEEEKAQARELLEKTEGR